VPDPVIIGVGNRWRGDDGAGLAVVAALRERGVRAQACGDPMDLPELLRGEDAAIVVDAARAGAPAGTLHRFEVSESGIPAGLRGCSTHALGVGDALEVCRAVGKLPARIVVMGIEGAQFGLGDDLSRPVANAVATVAAAIERELSAAAG